MISVHFQGKPFNITVIQAYAPTSSTEEAEAERFREDLQDFLELKPKKDVPFIIGDWNFCPYFSCVDHLRSLFATSQGTRCFCVQSLDSHLSTHEETEARLWVHDLPKPPDY